MFIVISVAILLVVLWMPSWAVLSLGMRLSVREVIQKAWRVWLIQVCLAVALIFLADAVGLTNPAGYICAICFGLGVLGAVALW